MTPEQWQRDIDVNLTGAFRVVQACLAGMRERGFGRVVAISSGAAQPGLPGQVAYSASKAGLIGMVKTIAAENVARGITANAVLPGLVETENVLAMPPEVLERVGPGCRRAGWQPRRGRRAGRLPRVRGGRLRHGPDDRDRRRAGPQHALDHVGGSHASRDRRHAGIRMYAVQNAA